MEEFQEGRASPRRATRMHPESREFMVRRLRGDLLPILNASPDSGLVFDGAAGQWMPDFEPEAEL
jgi:hypothetical protein